MNRLPFIAITAALPLLVLLTAACTEEEEYPEGCVQGQRCDPASADNDYCPQDECNWCSCAADGTWACTASICEDLEEIPDPDDMDVDAADMSVDAADMSMESTDGAMGDGDGGEEAPCRPGLACDPDAPGADYCPWDACNWCSCGADDTWMCTASSCMDAGAPDGGA